MIKGVRNHTSDRRSHYRISPTISGATVRIDLEALRRNLRRIRSMLSPGTQFMFVVKKNAYGHGLLPVSLLAQAEGVNWLGVFHIEEGLLLRESGIRLPILILSPSTDRLLQDAIAQELHLTVTNAATARDVMRASARLEKPACVHLKLDTGLGRLGFEPGMVAKKDLPSILASRNLRLCGVYSHLACAGNELDYSRHQLTRLLDFVKVFGPQKPLVHIASSGVLLATEFHLNMVRIGIAAYGAHPDLPGFEVVMRVTAPVIQVKTVKGGQSISYGRTYRTSRRTRIATVGTGYGDGFPVALSNKGWVTYAGQKLPVVGRVCMDQFMVDATRVQNIASGSEVELIGRSTSVTELAAAANTISYELLCSLGSRRVTECENKG